MIFLLLALLFIPSVALATGNETINTLPDSNKSTFRVDSQNFWRNEIPMVMGRYLERGFVSSGGTHGVSGNCTSPSFSFEAFTSIGNRVTADGAGGAISINYASAGVPACTSGTGTVRVGACAVAGNNAGNNWVRYGTTNAFLNFINSNPTPPADCAGLMDVTISDGIITKVTPAISPTSPVPYSQGVSIEEMGGVCDGTTDNSSVLQNAMNLATSNGTRAGKVTLTTKGCTSSTGYLFLVPIVIPKFLELDGNNANLTFNGVGAAFAIDGQNVPARLYLHNFNLYSISAGSTYGMFIANTSDVLIDKVSIEGRSVGGGTIVGNTSTGIAVTSSVGSLVVDVRITNSLLKNNKGSGILIGGTPFGMFVSHNAIENNGVNGILCVTTGGHVSVRDNVFRENGTFTPEVRVIGFETFNFVNNFITSLITSENVVEITGGTTLPATVKVDGNFIFAATNTNGIFINAFNPLVGNSVSYNYIRATVTNGIVMVGTANNILAVGNSCAGATLCVAATERGGTTVLKGLNETLVKKIAQGTISPILVNNASQTLMFSTLLHAYTLSNSGIVRIRSNWFYGNFSGSPSTMALVAQVGSTTIATCFFFSNPSSINGRAIFWDIELAAQGTDAAVRSSSRCGITDASTDPTLVSGGGSSMLAERMQVSFVIIPQQNIEANTTLGIFGSHQLSNPAISLYFQNITVESLGQ